MSTKTPVSILHEMYVCKGITPYYNLIVNGVGTHNPIFKYRLECDNIVSYGTGKSKKEAKHDAAQNALDQLKDSEVSNNDEEKMETNLMMDEANNVPVTSPYQDVLKENVVGTLTSICTTNRISEPVYELIGEEGPPHSKTFTIKCSVLHLTEVAEARTKKQAKHKSAKQMIIKLQAHFNCLDFGALDEEDDRKPSRTDAAKRNSTSPVNSADQDEIDAVKEKYIASNKSRNITENLGLKISTYHTITSDNNAFLTHPNFEKLKDYSADFSELDDPFSFLESLFEDTDIDLECKKMDTFDENITIMSITSCTSPPWTLMGMGNSKDEALRDAAIEMLEFFKTLFL